MIILSPYPKLQFVDNNGAPMAGCFLYTYAAGTDTPLATFTDNTGTNYNTNPIVLDAGGRANIWLDSNTSYKFKLLNFDSSVLWTVDNINNTTNDYVTIVNIIADLKAIQTQSMTQGAIQVLGYTSIGDGGGGLFYFDPNSTVVDDDGMIFKPTCNYGRWFRIVGADTEINIKWYGATGSGAEDASPFIQAANDYAFAQSPKWGIYLPTGTYTLNTNPSLTVSVRLAIGSFLQWSTFTLTIDPVLSLNDFTQHYITTGGINFSQKIIEIFPEWFGAKGDGSMNDNTPTTDDTAFIQAAINSCLAGQRVVLNSSKKYWSSQLLMKPGVNIIGTQSNEADLNTTPTNEFTSNLAFYGAGSTFLDLSNSMVGGLRGITIKDLIIDGISNTVVGIYLQTTGSNILNCTIRNCGTGAIGIEGNASVTNNTVAFNNIRNCVIGVFSYGAGCLNNTVCDNTFINCTDDFVLPVRTGWNIHDNIQSSLPVIGPVSHLFGVTNFNNETLGAPDLSSVELEKLGGINTENDWYRQYLLRFGSEVRIHSSIGYDATNITPRVDTLAWYEQSLKGSHHWGNLDKEYMTLDENGILSFPSSAQSITFKISTDYVYTPVTTPATLLYQGKFVTMTIDGAQSTYNTGDGNLRLIVNGSISTLTDYGALNPTVSITPPGSTNTLTIPSGYGFVTGQKLTIMINEFFNVYHDDNYTEQYQMLVNVDSYVGTTLSFTVISAVGIGAVLQKPQVLIQLPFVPQNPATLYPCVVNVNNGTAYQASGMARITNAQVIFSIATSTTISSKTVITYDPYGWATGAVGTNYKGFSGLTAPIIIV